MKKLLLPLFTALCAMGAAVNAAAATAEPQVIAVTTDKLSMILSVAPNGELLFRHFGGRIDDA